MISGDYQLTILSVTLSLLEIMTISRSPDTDFPNEVLNFSPLHHIPQLHTVCRLMSNYKQPVLIASFIFKRFFSSFQGKNSVVVSLRQFL